MNKPAIIAVDFRLYYPRSLTLYQYLECVHYGEKENAVQKQEFAIYMDPNENRFEFTLKSLQEWQFLYS